MDMLESKFCVNSDICLWQKSMDYKAKLNSRQRRQKAQQSIKDNELLAQFKAVEELDSKDKSTIKDIIDAFIKRSKLNQIAAL